VIADLSSGYFWSSTPLFVNHTISIKKIVFEITSYYDASNNYIETFIAKDAATSPADLKVGSKVAIEYFMTAKSIEVKQDKKSKK
jgi:hypothetical protein